MLESTGGSHTVLASQTSMLIASYFLCGSMPNMVWSVLSTSTKLAQSLRLYREASDDPLESGGGYLGWGSDPNAQKFIWWSIRVYDSFGAMSCGAPSGIMLEDCDVSYPRDSSPPISATCPWDQIFSIPQPKTSLLSQERIHNLWARHGLNPDAPPTLFDYQFKRFALYNLAHKALSKYTARTPGVVYKGQDLDAKLQEWELTCPQTIRLHGLNHGPKTFGISEKEWAILQLQAMALQVAYDGATILVNRPLLHYGLGRETSPCSFDPFRYSADACWHAALRISRLYERFPDTLLRLGRTSACAAFATQLMTAGVILATIAASDFRAARSYDAKAGVGRIIKIQGILKEHSPMAEAGAVLLRELLNVVLIEELDGLCDGVPQTTAIDSNFGIELGDALESQHITRAPIFSNATKASPASSPLVRAGTRHERRDLLSGVPPADVSGLIEGAAEEIENLDNWWRSDPATFQTENWADFDASRLAENIVPVNLPGMSQALFNLERDWIATINGTGHF
ncbi:hypothetical protein B0T10DRAFT_591091 [Thelonectria olida]|uniref:Xylanolytic transcriptional activator regulatory domain-containing protein n=1 Tax=Thelonectria olida TaxID=1576542 RepID=A0A9P9AHK3_9HYPO|nr:hypothetical protein B0T10DRAFT_591091 [Thelonectria olida]